MNIKIESGAKVQITDKPIYNIYGDVVNEKNVLLQDSGKEENSQSSKPESRKADKKDVIIIRRERTVWRGKEITHSFDYRPKDISIEERNKRLSTFFNLLNKKYISHTEMNTFIDIFSGVETTEYIVWKRTIVELQYMLEQLINKQLITWTRPAPGKWQIASARFRHEHNSKEGRVIDSLVPDQFNKIPKKSKLKEHPF